MAFDRYAPCPGGTCKKIKFCCDDLFGELEQIQKMLDGEQRLACLEHVKQTEKKYPDRACLLAVKIMLEAALGNEDDARTTTDHFLKVHPSNPVALAERAIDLASQQKPVEAVSALQDAIAVLDKEIPTRVYDALGLVSQVLLASGMIVPARPHLIMQASLAGETDPRPLSLLLRLNGAPDVPLILKEDRQLMKPPGKSKWRKAGKEAYELATRGAWKKALAQFEAIAEENPDEWALWWNLAILRGWTADTTGAGQAWRKYATLDVPETFAIEAEAMAQLLTPPQDAPQLDVMLTEFTLKDHDIVQAALTADRRASAVPVDPSAFAEDDSPPPIGVYYLIDRELPETGVGIAADQIPVVLGRLALFGRQTDREPRLELLATSGEQLDQAKQILTELLTDGAFTKEEEKVIGHDDPVQVALTTSWRFPDDTPPLDRENLLRAEQREGLLHRWTEMPLPELDGKTAREAAGDDAMRTRLEAAVLLLELADAASQGYLAPGELRTELGLAQLETLTAENTKLDRLSLVRMNQLDVSTLNDEELVETYRRAAVMAAGGAVRALATEVTQRESLAKKVDQAEAFGILSRHAHGTDEALTFVAQAKAAAEAAEQSPAPWLLAELSIRIERGEPNHLQQLLETLYTNHMQEPGVAKSVMELLARTGLIDPSGQPAGMPGAMGDPMAPQGTAPPETAADSGGLWTPDGASDAPQEKSKLWTPDS